MSSQPKPITADAHELVEMLERRLNAERAERRRLQQQLDEMRRARDGAVAANHSKSSFLANMSHEIRTPLTSIIGFAELLQDPQVAGSEKVDAASTIVRNGRHLLDVINDILDMSKIESNQLTLECLDVKLPALLSDVEALASSRAVEKGLLFTLQHHLPLPSTLRTDPVRLKQILLNFCSNAIKFSERGEVRLAVRFDAPNRALSFEVVDRGIGMNEQELSRLFRPFAQADLSTTRKFGGTGLGLYISKQLADRLGARIQVASRPGQGSRFSVSVPLGLEDEAAEMLHSESEFAALQQPAFQITAIDVPALSGRVLVAEDGVDNQRLLGSLLRQSGVEFDMVGDGQAAVDRARAFEYALVFMDIQMPLLDGVSATRALRHGNYRGPIVALTANVMQRDVAQYRQAGCTDVLAKPIDRARFYEVLARYVGDAHAPEQAGVATKALDYEAELKALTVQFVQGLPAIYGAIEGAARIADRVRLKSLLHALKGTAGSYGFSALTAKAAEIEAGLSAFDTQMLIETCRTLSEVGSAPGEPT